MKIARWTAALSATGLLAPATAYAQELPDLGKLAGAVRWGGVAFSVLIIVGAMIALRIVGNVSDRLAKRFTNRRPTVQKLESITRFIIVLTTAGIALGLSVRLESTAVTVIGGAMAFAVGFAMRDLVAAFIAGITILFDRPFQVGDRVGYAGQYGDIIRIGLRSVRMNTLDHNVITIPNNKILTDVTASGNYGALEMQVPMDFYVGIDQDVKRAAELIREACLVSMYVHLDRPVPVLAKQLIVENYFAVQLKARPYVFDCKYEKDFETDVHFRVLEAFAAHGILPPGVLHRRMTEGLSRAPAVRD
ncbi:MAG: mechanosensitive ion channel [Deltaproteobacteria bacterium]|nr:mechanosensitive ion channel [Deltaproteobacteria bacterium]